MPPCGVLGQRFHTQTRSFGRSAARLKHCVEHPQRRRTRARRPSRELSVETLGSSLTDGESPVEATKLTTSVLVDGSSAPSSGSPQSQNTVFSKRALSVEVIGTVDSKAFLPERCQSSISSRYFQSCDPFAEGGSATVYEGMDKVSCQRVAIKRVPTQAGKQNHNFRREVQIMKELDHPSICKLLETYEEDKVLFCVLELCEGGELFQRVVKDGPLTERVAVDVFGQVTSAIGYAHARKIAHRDLKPENILFCTQEPCDASVKVIDWGLGAFFGKSRMRSPVGSMTYAAPEVLTSTGEAYTHAVDLWSLGVVAYISLSGKLPFFGNQQKRIADMQSGAFVRNKEWAGFSTDVQDFISGLLRSDPAQRFTADVALAHPWLKNAAFSQSANADLAEVKRVLMNLLGFRRSPRLYCLCRASLARQLSHDRLKALTRVFCEMDTNRDGVLDALELRNGFQRVFGDGKELRDMDELFACLDLNASGAIEYTEFCAAGLSKAICEEEQLLWLAFKTFDVDDSLISDASLQQMIRKADATQSLTPNLCSQASFEVLFHFDKNADGCLDFHEFTVMVNTLSRVKGPLQSTPSGNLLTGISNLTSDEESETDEDTVCCQLGTLVRPSDLDTSCFDGVLKLASVRRGT